MKRCDRTGVVQDKIDSITLGRGFYKTFSQGIEREWMIANGIGGYAGLSVIGSNARYHHGLLIASLHPPVERYLILSRINEKISFQNAESHDLKTLQYSGKNYANGQNYLQCFSYDGLAHYHYQVTDLKMKKTISMVYGKNQVVLQYEIRNGNRPCDIIFTPYFQYREHGAYSTETDLVFKDHTTEDRVISLVPEKNDSVTISFSINEGIKEKREVCFDKELEYQIDLDTGSEHLDTAYLPYDFSVHLNAMEHKTISMVCTLIQESEEIPAAEVSNAYVSDLILKEYKRLGMLLQNSSYRDCFSDTLTVAADRFIVERLSTGYKTVLAGYPWFTDWGRDTMIALSGLCLSTGRWKDAEGILRTFALYEKNGLVPNMFPDEGTEPLYNTVDASMWYFYAVQRYLECTEHSRESLKFVKKEIYPVLLRIAKAYESGTDFSIYMDTDGLIHAGSNLDQVTWMDVRVGELVVTPRHGKPVEINALWYNALKFLEELADIFEDPEVSLKYKRLAEVVKESFLTKFWNEAEQCLYDVAEEEGPLGTVSNGQIRPNQIWAVSLPYTMLSESLEQAIVDKVYKELYTDFGLRSLSPADSDYHGRYVGKLMDRDLAYHQGTVWAFPLGGFLLACLKVYGKDFAMQFVEPLKTQLTDGCIGQIAEIFDADAPHCSRGCYAQAWSVGEILWAYQAIMKK